MLSRARPPKGQSYSRNQPNASNLCSLTNPMAQSTTYMLSSRDRDTEESTRLDFQHVFLKSTFADRLLHPRIPDLGPGAYVADVGTGNGVWLNDLARTLAGDNKDANYKNNSASQANSRAAQLVGFDVTSEKFAEQNETGVKMVVHDCTERFPQEWWGLFDVVHLRLLVYAIREADVKRVVWNVIELLRGSRFHLASVVPVCRMELLCNM